MPGALPWCMMYRSPVCIIRLLKNELLYGKRASTEPLHCEAGPRSRARDEQDKRE